MRKHLLFFLAVIICSLLKAQCPQVYNYQNNLSSRPYFISCNGTANYTINFKSNTNWNAYSIDWGDGTSADNGASYTANTDIFHTYTTTVADTFAITLMIPAQNCTLTGVVVMESAAVASIVPLSTTTVCVAKTFSVSNQSLNNSKTTHYSWDFGDGTIQAYDYTNAGATITYSYDYGAVNCETTLKLTAKNYCNTSPHTASINPMKVFELDMPNISVSGNKYITCWPDNKFVLINSSVRNCYTQGNTTQRKEMWNLGDYWGFGHDSIIDWRNWAPSPASSVTISFPAQGSYHVVLRDSNRCGIEEIDTWLSIINPPVADVAVPISNYCVGATLTFTNTSDPGYSYSFNGGNGGNFTSIGYGGMASRTYTNVGTYTVSLRAYISTAGFGAACSDTAKIPITIGAIPVADFSVNTNVGCSPLNVQFTDMSINAASWYWDFGDGNTNTLQSPTHNYTNAGTYVATLTALGTTSCSNTKTISITVKQPPVADFSFVPPCVNALGNFTNNSTSSIDPITRYSWDFGDGSAISTSINSTHTFTSATTYTVKLIAKTAFCSDSIEKAVTVMSLPTISFSANPSGSCTPLAITFPTLAGITSYTWNFGDATPTISTSSAASHTFNNNTTSTQTYTVNLIGENNFACVNSATATVTVFAKPSVNFAASPTVGCHPLTVTYTNNSTGATSYTWDFGNSATSNATNTSTTYTNTSNTTNQNFTTTLIATSLEGCQNSATQTILVYYKPLSSFTVDAPTCQSTTFSFTNTSVGSQFYYWSFGDASAVSSLTNPTHTYTYSASPTGTFITSLIVLSASGCTDIATSTVTVYTAPTASFALTPTVGCSPFTATFTNNSLAAQSYSWNFGDGSTISTSTNATHTYSNSSNTTDQNFTATLIATSANGCQRSFTQNILVHYQPQASFTVSPSFLNPPCGITTFSYANTSIGATTHTWNFGDGSPVSSNSVHTYTLSPTALELNCIPTLSVTSVSGCTNSVGNIQHVFAHPTASFVITPTVACSLLTTTLTNNSYAASSYEWNFGDGSAIVTSTNTTHTYSNNSNTTDQTFTCTLITYNDLGIALNAPGCSDSLKIPVLVRHKPSAQFTLDNPQCLSQKIEFTNNSIGATSYTWNFGNGSPVSNSVNPVYTYSNSTGNNITYTVQLIVSTADNCSDTAFAYPEIYAKPIAQYAVTHTADCSPFAITFTNSSIAANTYEWRFEDDIFSTDGSTLTSYTYYNTSHTSNRNYTCTLVAYNNNGCRDSVSHAFLVYYKPNAAFSIDTPYCAGGIMTFKNNSSPSGVYNWNFGDGSTSTSSLSPTHVYTNNTSATKTHTSNLIITSEHNCKDTTSAIINVYPKLSVSLSMLPDSGCAPLSVKFQTITGVTQYKWYINDVLFGNTGNISTTFTLNGLSTETHSITLIAKDAHTCEYTVSKKIKILPKPQAEFSVQPEHIYINRTMTTSNISTLGKTYAWNFDDGKSSTAFEPTHIYTTAGQYVITLIVTSSRGCRDTSSLDILVESEAFIKMPNAFTPNPHGSVGPVYDPTDLSNDIFHPVLAGVDKDKYYFSIYSRWGELLFETKKPDEGWDGYYRGKLCIQDVYIWKISAVFWNGDTWSKTGEVLLLR